MFTNIPVPINSAKRALRVPILSFITSSEPTYGKEDIVLIWNNLDDNHRTRN